MIKKSCLSPNCPNQSCGCRECLSSNATMLFISEYRVNSLLTLSCLVGLGLSLYSYIVELQLEHDHTYQPMCDINPQVSCSKAFKSEFGKGFGIFPEGSPFHKPNSLFGIMFYSMIATLAQSSSRFITSVSLCAVILSNFMSLYLAYILYYILQDLCVICVSTYVVNVVNLILLQLKIKLIKVVEFEEAERRNQEEKKEN